METSTRILTLFLATTLLGGCVSKKKYKDSEAALAATKKELADERANENAFKNSTSAELQQKQKELSDKEAQVKEREQKLNEMMSALTAQKDAVLNLKQQVCSALKCFSPDELTVIMKDGKLYVSLSEQLLFPSGSEDVNKRGEEAIEMLSKVLASSDLEVMVEGDTDPVPIHTARNKDNWDLSVHRATSVTRLMIKHGLKPQRIISCGRAEYFPVTTNETEAGRAQNRRTEIVLAPKLDKLWKLTEEPNTENSTSQR
ncbi:MAG: OmpA family protein [Bacteroidia bacterium]